MKSNQNPGPSKRIEDLIPSWIYGDFVTVVGNRPAGSDLRSQFPDFIEKADESEQRVGFGQDILQNLLTYRDFDTYKDPLVRYNILAVNGEIGGGQEYEPPLITSLETLDINGNSVPEFIILASMAQGAAKEIRVSGRSIEVGDPFLDIDEDEVMELMDGRGFPRYNGVIMIDEEIILYRRREGNFLYGLQRGASATILLPQFATPGQYVMTTPARHAAGSVVVNISVLFLVGMLELIHKSYTPNIESDRICPDINRSSLLQNIKDFFAAKGSKLGVKAFFKMLFCENDVDVFYPGDRMITPSKSTYYEGKIFRTVPVPQPFCDPEVKYVLPTSALGTDYIVKNYNEPNEVYGRGVVDYSTVYPIDGEDQYELFANKKYFEGTIPANPCTTLTRKLLNPKTAPTDVVDVKVITVESTLGFPDKGLLFIDNEAIYYGRKSLNQFFDCVRGKIGVAVEHSEGKKVYGPYYIETQKLDPDNNLLVSRSFPLGLVESVDIVDPGLLHSTDDYVIPNGPGMIDPREQALCRIDEQDRIIYTFRENYDDLLTRQYALPVISGQTGVGLVMHTTRAVDGVYYDDSYVFVSSSGFPEYTIGPFNPRGIQIPPDLLVGPGIDDSWVLSIIPRHENRKANYIMDDEDGTPQFVYSEKGNDRIGVFVDGVRAYSNVSKKSDVTGKIASFEIVNHGQGYKNPTVLIDGVAGRATASVDETTGQILSITQTLIVQYTNNPPVKVTSGQGAAFELTFDRYGRLEEVIVTNKGRFYLDRPQLQVVDSSGRGKGAVLNCEVLNGGIESVKVLNTGIDYNPRTTNVRAVPIGTGAEIKATTEFYQFDRYAEVVNEVYYTFDKGNGFLWEPVSQEGGIDKTIFGYVCDPVELRRSTGDDGTKHSPLLGWAYDGNPIYGPYGYKNNTDDTDGVERQQSAYVLMKDRSQILPAGGGTSFGSHPPSDHQYPMGTFVEDYQFAPYDAADIIVDDELTNGIKYIPLITSLDTVDASGTPKPEFEIHTSDDQFFILVGVRVDNECDDGSEVPQLPNNILNANNCKICNTPEFPKELYPNGVEAYFITIDEEGTPQFPYIIGKTFCNRPISQVVDIIDSEGIEALERTQIYSSMIDDETELNFDFTKVERLRNPYLQPTKDELDLEITSVSNGSINDVLIQKALPLSTRVGDGCLFDNKGTRGSGADAKVTFVEGEPVVDSKGTLLIAKLISHRQRINLDNTDNSGNSFVFIPTKLIYSYNPETGGRSEAIVESYNPESKVLIVQTQTQRLIDLGDVIVDHRGNDAYIEGSPQQIAEFNTPTSSGPSDVQVRTSVPGTRTDGSSLIQGDLWWSLHSGRLYVYYTDETPNTEGLEGQWVNTHPIGVRPFPPMLPLSQGEAPYILGDGGVDKILGDDLKIIGNSESRDGDALLFDDVPTIITDKHIGTDAPIPTPPLFDGTDESVVILSEYRPLNRPDGSGLRVGDLWWSPHTGIMYIYNNDDLNGIFDPLGPNADGNRTSEWICTDPAGMVPNPDWRTDLVFYKLSTEDSNVVEQYILSEDDEELINVLKTFDTNYDTATNYIWPDPLKLSRDIDVNIFSGGVRAIISEKAPTEYIHYFEDGTCENREVSEGNLWWSPLTGKLYIYYNDGNSIQWVVTNPQSSISNEYGYDYTIPSYPGGGGPGGPGGDDGTGFPGWGGGPIINMPELETTRRLFFDNLDYFVPQDIVEFQVGAPGTDNQNETAKLLQVNYPEASGIFVRGYEDERLPLPDGTITIDKTRALYTINTLTPHKLNIGDFVEISGSEHDEVNGLHQVVEAGTVIPAEGDVLVSSDGKIMGVDITCPGMGYTEDFYVTFESESGFGALGVARVDPNTGQVIEVEMINTGTGYSVNSRNVRSTEEVTIDYVIEIEERGLEISTESTGVSIYAEHVDKIQINRVAFNTDVKVNLGSELANTRFSIYVHDFYESESGSLSYIASGDNVENAPAKIQVTSAGTGYKSLPSIAGLYHRFIDRAVTEIELDANNGIESVKIISGGSRYTNPIAVFVDLEGNGCGATAQVSKTPYSPIHVGCSDDPYSPGVTTDACGGGVITYVTVTNPGCNYINPVLVLVEADGHFIATTKDIGKIKSFGILDPGRKISADRSLKPELHIETKLVVLFDDPYATFNKGDTLYQGIETNKRSIGVVEKFDSERQIVTIMPTDVTVYDTDITTNTIGILKKDEYIYNQEGISAMVVTEGQADCRVVVNGSSEPEGRFIDQTSMISEYWPVIQDSYRYQRFSYVISSPLQEVVYDTFVEKVIHPSGFKRFADVTIHDSSYSTFTCEEVVVVRS